MRINRFTAGFPDLEVPLDEGQNQILEAYRQLRPESMTPLPRLAVGAVSTYLAEELPAGGIGVEELEADSRIRSRLTVGMLGSCQTALVVCSNDPGMGARHSITVPEHDLVRAAFEAIAEGANELGQAGSEGLVHLVSRAAPPTVDGLLRFSTDPDRLAHHVVTWYLLTLSLGFNADVIDREVQLGLAMVLALSGPHLA